MCQCASRLAVPCTAGAPGASAVSGVKTPGVGSYSTSIASTAACAASSVSAATSATGWPTTRRPSRVMTASAMVTLSARIGLDRIDDLGIAGAAAEVAFERGADGLAIGARLALEEGERRQQHARRAEPALHRAVAYERFLQRVQAAITLEATQRRHRAAAHARGQHQAPRRPPAAHQHRAHAAHALVA